MDISWRTSKNDHPKGKPKVYLSCYGADFKRYSEKILKQLFEICDCAVYFYPLTAKVQLDDDYRFNLNQMHLMVIPVTADLLSKPNRTMDFDVPYAKSQNIPVLPLLQEENLVDLFNSRFGTTQFLCETADDRTAIPYKEKLKKFLDFVLTDDALSEEIHKVFCAKIFLSYRKKDRAYAQKLMSLVHQEPKFQNVAIWYDEFLTPGDDFERNIHQELEDSNLFLLAVTPNVLEPSNYVMRKEYPAASKRMPVVPAEMVATELTELRVCYPGIADPLDAYNQEKRTTVLGNLLHSKLRQGVSSRDKYLLGMAYLRGIDVEKDPQRGVVFLQEAAAEGDSDAAHRLAKIYSQGDHVPKDYGEVKRWLTRMTEITANQFAENANESAAGEHYWTLTIAGSICEQNLDYEGAERYYLQAIAQTQILRDRYGQFGTMLADARRCLARSYSETDQYDKALSYQKTAVDIAEQLYEAVQTFQKGKYLVDCCNELASYYRNVDNLKEAVRYYEKTAEVLVWLLDKQNAPNLVWTLLSVYEDLGDILETLGDKKRRRLYEKQADRLLKKYRKQLENGTVFNWMAVAGYYMKRGLEKIAIWWMERALASTLSQEEENNYYDNRSLLASQYSMLGLLWASIRNRKKAKKYYLLSLELCEALAKEYPKVFRQRELADAYISLGELSDITYLFDDADALYSDSVISRRDRPIVEEAYDWYCKALELVNQFADDQNQTDCKQKMEILDALGRLSKALERQDEAIEYYRQYGCLACDLCDMNPSDLNKNRYADACFKLALLTQDADLMIEARDCWMELSEAYPGNRTYKKRRNEAQRLLDA